MRSFESREDYLETILLLKQEKGAVQAASFILEKFGLLKKHNLQIIST